MFAIVMFRVWCDLTCQGWVSDGCDLGIHLGCRVLAEGWRYSSGSLNAPGHSTPGQQHNSFMSIAAVTPQQNVIKLRRSGFILYNSLRRLCASLNLFLGGGLPAFWWFLVELVVQPPGHLQKLYHPQHLSDAL
jgi:hypothetical protein